MGSMRVRLAALLAAALMATAVQAAEMSAAPETPGNALSRHIRVLAGNPRDFNALIGAGRAALELGDVQAAAGFFGRAEEANPNAPAAKAGLGAAMAHMGDADGAIFYFDQAARLGAAPLAIALDRGLARDLNGDLAAAQGDYRLAIQSLNSDEGRRRLALSLAIGRDRAGALTAIQPLLNRRDPAAQRTRAFVLALVGDQAGASQAIEAVMPGGSARFAPFFTLLPYLSVQEKAAAVHLGMFPDNAAAKVAAARGAQRQPEVAARTVQPAQGGPIEPNARTVTTRPAARQPVQVAAVDPPPAPKPSFTLPSQSASATPSFSLPSSNSASPTVSSAARDPASSAENDPTRALSEAEAAAGNLSGIDKLLATIAEAPPPPLPKVEAKEPDRTAEKVAVGKKTADKKALAKAAAEKKAREVRLAAEKKEREEAAKLGVKGTYWVQLAGGSNQDRMATEYKKLSAKSGALLKSRSGYVTSGKDYFRLVVGPFNTKAESQSFVNKLEKEGVDGFSWTRTPAQIKIEKISSR